MAQASNIVVNDGKATPVPHTFVPVSDANGEVLFEDRAVGIFIGFSVLGIRTTRPSRKNRSGTGRYLTAITLNVPVLETLSNNSSGFLPAPTVAYANRVRTEYDFAERSTLADRKDIRVLHANILSNAQVIAAVEQFDSLSV